MTKQTDALEAELGNILISSGMVKNAYDPDWTFMLKKLADTVTASNLERVDKAINNAPFDISSTEFPYKREHQEEGLNIAEEAIKQEFTESDDE